jgi:hypothetical protein
MLSIYGSNLTEYIRALFGYTRDTFESTGTVGAQYSYQSTRVSTSIPYGNRVSNRVLCATGLIRIYIIMTDIFGNVMYIKSIAASNYVPVEISL